MTGDGLGSCRLRRPTGSVCVGRGEVDKHTGKKKGVRHRTKERNGRRGSSGTTIRNVQKRTSSVSSSREGGPSSLGDSCEVPCQL